jgi:uncharacterized membrane protein
VGHGTSNRLADADSRMAVAVSCATTGMALIVGAIVGRSVFGDRHPAMFFLVLLLAVGATALLTGLSMGRIRDLLRLVDQRRR